MDKFQKFNETRKERLTIFVVVATQCGAGMRRLLMTTTTGAAAPTGGMGWNAIGRSADRACAVAEARSLLSA